MDADRSDDDFQLRAQQRLGRNIRVARAELGITQDRLAAETGLQRTHVSAIELGKRNPALSTTLKLAVALGVSMPDLMRDVGT